MQEGMELESWPKLSEARSDPLIIHEMDYCCSLGDAKTTLPVQVIL